MEDSAPPHRFLLGGGPSPRLVGGIQEGSRRGLGRNVPALSLALIHRSAWNKNSRKFISKILNIPPCEGVAEPLSAILSDGTVRHLVTRMDRYARSWMLLIQTNVCTFRWVAL